MNANGKKFLFLQGPHGPYFAQLAKMLGKAGASCLRIGFNAGDQAFWREKATFLPFLQPLDQWPAFFRETAIRHEVSDVVLYGDTRPVHAQAVEVCRDLGLTVHVFEEGYLRPYWVTYERGGSNGNSRLMEMSVAQMQAALRDASHDLHEVPAHWGDMKEHVFYGALYHWFVMFRNRRFQHFTPHRALPVGAEFRLYLRRLALMPWHRLDRLAASWRIRRGGFPYHLALLQLEHDASFTAHSPFATMPEFVRLVIEGFATGAAAHHHLVFKAHPLEDGRTPLRQQVRKIAAEHGLSDRVHFVRGGKLAGLLDHAVSAVAINSTAAQQALWRGLPVRAFGTAIYSKPEFVSQQPLDEFFANPQRPNSDAYRGFRQYLLETSQFSGGFYAARSRRQLLRQIVDAMLLDQDPYQALSSGTAAPRQQLTLVK